MTPALNPARSYLVVPANRPDRIAKAHASGAHVVIVDLEDAVADSAKQEARSALAAALDPARRVTVRINNVVTDWFAEDLVLCRHPAVQAVMVPKAEDAELLRYLAEHLDKPLLPLIETARGLWNALELARAPCVERLAFGPLDLSVDLGLTNERAALAPYAAQLVLASRVAGLAAPLDGPTTSIEDVQLIRSETLAARGAGFGARTCIHPKQVAVVNECFVPTAEEQAWARRILEAARAAGGGVVAVDGQMVDRPLITRAEQVLTASGCAPKR
jgi:citrate lyase subunit beta/citryl-CoA lyase